jgi:thioredoxin-related protein
MRLLRLALLAAALLPSWASTQESSAHAIDIPPWFSESLLEIPDEVRDAAKQGKRLMLYFGQDGCPYCKALMQTNFSQKAIVEKTRKHFVAIALNIWGDREVTWTDGRTMSEKELARALKVQFTPTLLFLDERGAVAVRLNGYYAPHRFDAALDYVIGRMEKKVPLADYLASKAHEAANPWLADEPFFLKPPYDLRRGRGAKPVAVLFETPHCAACDELHREGFTRPEITALLKRFDVVRFSLADRAAVVTPAGAKTNGEAWARALGIAYTPSMVFFDGSTEVLRVEAYLRPFHLASALEYVASGAYRKEPSFQRFIQARAERLRERGDAVDLWK